MVFMSQVSIWRVNVTVALSYAVGSRLIPVEN